MNKTTKDLVPGDLFIFKTKKWVLRNTKFDNDWVLLDQDTCATCIAHHSNEIMFMTNNEIMYAGGGYWSSDVIEKIDV